MMSHPDRDSTPQVATGHELGLYYTLPYIMPQCNPFDCSKRTTKRGSGILATDVKVRVISQHSTRSLRNTLSEIWANRELLYFLVWKEIKIRYKQTAIGATWAILQPLLTMLIFTAVFGMALGIKTGNVPYPIFVYSGYSSGSTFRLQSTMHRAASSPMPSYCRKCTSRVCFFHSVLVWWVCWILHLPQ